jgi:microcystin-dependent protein
MAYDFDETSPADDSYISDFPLNERDARTAKKDAFEVEHELTKGQHDHVTLNEQGADRATAVNEMALYCKNVGSVPELFYRPENNGTAVQLTQVSKFIQPIPSGNKATRDALTHVEGMMFLRTDLFPGAIDVSESAAWVRRVGPAVGDIIMWSGSVAVTAGYLDARDGWALCDGGTVNGFVTPDLTGQFVAGYSGAGDYANIGDTGGAATVTLAGTETPEHRHYMVKDGTADLSMDTNDCILLERSSSGGDMKYGLWGATEEADIGESSVPKGTYGEAHENRPQFYVLAYIVFVDVA